jgi:hypothetical protein
MPDADVPTSSDDAGSVVVGVRPPPAAQCGLPGVQHKFANLPEFATLLVRRWLLCSHTGIARTSVVPGEAGLELRADGTFAILVGNEAGAVVPGTAPNTAGTYLTVGNGPNAIQLDLKAKSGELYAMWVAIASDSPRMLFLETVGGPGIAYAPETTDGWPSVDVPQPSAGAPHAAPPACDVVRGTTSRPITAADTSPLAGDWILCQGPELGRRVDAAGLRIDGTGAWSTLVWDASNQLAAATDLYDSGTYTFADDVGTFRRGDGSIATRISSFDVPPMLEFHHIYGSPALYVRRDETGW